MLTGDASGRLVRSGASSGAVAAGALATGSNMPMATTMRPTRLATRSLLLDPQFGKASR